MEMMLRIFLREMYPPPSSELEDHWRPVNWSGKEDILEDLRDLNPQFQPLKILLFGPVGAGKSCFINSVQRALLGRNVNSALESSTASGESFTLSFKTHKMKKRGGGYCPFILCDVMGLESADGGIRTEDIIKVLEGHILDDYCFNPRVAITPDHPKYKQDPKPHDRIHCLVSIIPADMISRMDPSVINKMQAVRRKASELNIPQVIVLTKVDRICELVNTDLRKLYYSRKIKEKGELSSQKLGISLSNIYPVKNYHAEITEDADIDVLILMALRDIVCFANDYADCESLCEELENPWRLINWSEKEEILEELRDLNPHLQPLKILLYGPVGAGKSCFINSVQRALLGRNVNRALEGSATSGTTFTFSLKMHKMKKRGGGHYPFVFRDLMGLETAYGGIQTEDIEKVLQGHILDEYNFNPRAPITPDNPKYKLCPEPCDRIHCLVSVVSAEAISRVDPSVIDKMNEVRKRASELNIPQVTVLTKVDKACELVHGDLRKLYYSRKIKEKVEESGHTLGISLNNIYPVKNYHVEITKDANIDVLILMALRDIVYFASDYVESI